MRKQLIESAICTVLFALTLAACGGKSPNAMIPTLFPQAHGVSLTAGTHSGSHLVPAGTRVLTAAFLQTGVVNLTQSFDAVCDTYTVGSVPADDFVELPGCNSFVSVIDSSGGKRIHDPGTLADLVVDVNLAGGQDLTCENKTDTAAVLDGTHVRAFLNPATGQVFIGNDAAQTKLSCTVTLPQGAIINTIEAQWVKQ